MRRLALALGCLALAAPAPADAGWKIQRAKVIAQAAFPNDCPDVQVRWGVPPAEAIEVAKAAAWTHRISDPCVVWFRPGRHDDWPTFCTVMVHEYGHLAGQPHSDDPMNVMYPETIWYWNPCHDHGRKAVGLPPGGYGWD